MVVEIAYSQRGAESATAAIFPFKIQVPNAVLADLKRRLADGRFADEFPDAGWDYGTNLAYLKSLIEYWRDKFDWRSQEKRLNAFDQFKTNIDGVDIEVSTPGLTRPERRDDARSSFSPSPSRSARLVNRWGRP